MLFFTDWEIRDDGTLIARQYDNLSREFLVGGDIPDGYTWDALFGVKDKLDIVTLSRGESGLFANLQRETLALSGTYYVQLRATMGAVVKHTNVIRVYIPGSLSGDAAWPEVPTEFSQVEARIRDLNDHPPIPGSNGYWTIWDADTQKYAESVFPVGTEGPKGDTPVRGTDYWTEADQDKIVSDTLKLIKDSGIVIQDKAGAKSYRLIIESGILKLQEV